MQNVWKRADQTQSETLGESMLIINPATGVKATLNAAAAAIWSRCDGSTVLSDYAVAFCERLSLHGFVQPVACAAMVGVAQQSSLTPAFKILSAGAGGRRRPSPRGVSGPV